MKVLVGVGLLWFSDWVGFGVVVRITIGIEAGVGVDVGDGAVVMFCFRVEVVALNDVVFWIGLGLGLGCD